MSRSQERLATDPPAEPRQKHPTTNTRLPPPVRGTVGATPAEGGASARTADLRLFHIHGTGIAQGERGAHDTTTRWGDGHSAGRDLPRRARNRERGWRRRRPFFYRDGLYRDCDFRGGAGPAGKGGRVYERR